MSKHKHVPHWNRGWDRLTWRQKRSARYMCTSSAANDATRWAHYVVELHWFGLWPTLNYAGPCREFDHGGRNPWDPQPECDPP